MPLVDRRSNLTPANSRASDVARRLVESIAPMQQQRMMAAFKVQGIEAILYSKLNSGRRCPCADHNVQVSKLSPDGKASTGSINRILAGNDNFGISSYNPNVNELHSGLHFEPNYPINQTNPNLGTDNTVGPESDPLANFLSDEAVVGDNGQYSPDLDSLFENFDMSNLGTSDVSCPICFGTTYVGGYAPFRTWRHVVIPAEFETDSYIELPERTLSPGSHTTSITLPKGALKLDAFRTLNGDKVTASKFYIDGIDTATKNILSFCDGLPHQLQIVTDHPLTHFESQFSVSSESIYFEVPKLTRTSDIGLLEQQEPFQILVSPDVPDLKSLDIIAESQLGKILIVQSANPWNTRNRQMLGWECQVRVAQPQELWRILPFRQHIAGQKTVKSAIPSRTKSISGLGLKGFTF